VVEEEEGAWRLLDTVPELESQFRRVVVVVAVAAVV
jgi:hypothetical protein